MGATMKTLALSQFMAFLIFTLDLSEISAFSIGQSASGVSSDPKFVESPRFCLEPPNDLPLCEFTTEDDEYVQDPTEERGFLRRARSSGQHEDRSATNDDGNRPIVFKIERCIPPGILSRFPLCDEKTLIDSNGERSSFLPFNVVGNPNGNFEAPLEFPQFNMDDWRTDVNIPWTSLLNNKDDVEKKKNAEVSEDSDSGSSENRRPMVIRVKREIEGMPKSMPESNIFRKFSSWASANERDSQTNVQRRSRESTQSRDHPGNLNEEFLYEKAVPYDPEVFKMARHGSEFPYAQAIPYDPKKMEERKNGGFKRSFASPSTESSCVDEKKAEAVELPSSKRPEETSAPTRNSEITETAAKTENFSAHERNNEEGSKKDEAEVSLQIPRVAEGTIETSTTSDDSVINNHYEIPEKWSEFPYSKAIPFDPSKFRHPRSSEQQKSSMTIPYDFPYGSAITYDPWKLRSIEINENHSSDKRSSVDERSTLSMA